MGTYRWDSRDYELHSSGQRRWARELIAKLSLEGTEELLDIGCGDGKVTAEIAGLLGEGRVIGIDSSESMIALATTRYPPADHSNLSFRLMDAVNMHFDGLFDVVFSNAALHWVRNHVLATHDPGPDDPDWIGISADTTAAKAADTPTSMKVRIIVRSTLIPISLALSLLSPTKCT